MLDPFPIRYRLPLWSRLCLMLYRFNPSQQASATKTMSRSSMARMPAAWSRQTSIIGPKPMARRTGRGREELEKGRVPLRAENPVVELPRTEGGIVELEEEAELPGARRQVAHEARGEVQEALAHGPRRLIISEDRQPHPLLDVVVTGDDELFLVGEVAVDRPRPHPGALGHERHGRGVEAVLGHHALHRLEDRSALVGLIEFVGIA